MTGQALVVALLVAGCAVYAVWTLMPAALRRRLAGWLARAPLPAPLGARFARLAAANGGCGCDGCDRSELSAKRPTATPAESPAAAPRPQPIVFHPRTRR